MQKTFFKTLDELPTCQKVDDVATAMNISRNKAYGLVKSDGFPRIMVDKRIVIPKEAFINWMEKHTRISEGVQREVEREGVASL